MSEKCIIYISSTNYKLVSAGTEKFMSSIINYYKKNNIHSIQIFPLANLNNKIARLGLGRKYIGINYDGGFVGAYYIEDILGALNYLCKIYNLHCDGIIINQLYSWSLKELATALNKLELPIYIMIHDYMMICPYLMTQDSAGITCGKSIEQPSTEHCSECKYCNNAIDYFGAITIFFHRIYPLVKKVIFPSDSTKNNWLSVFPEFSNIGFVRPHLKYSSIREVRKINSKIRIGYLGVISSFKGYNEWKYLIDKLDKNRFDFFYFGKYIGQAEKDGAKGILVDFNKTDLPGMVSQLITNQIDIAFLWSNCQETYSYTYFEAFEAGSWIITSKHSGNITAQVACNQNGIAFETIEDCINYLSKSHHEITTFKAINVVANTDFDEFIFPNNEYHNWEPVKKPSVIVSFIYKNLRSSNSEN